MISAADAPSVIWLELPAVTLPSSLNDGFSLPSDSTVVSGRIPSSATTGSPSAPFTAMISFWKRPSAVARAARCWLWAANVSRSSRLRPHFSAMSSAEIPCGTRPPTAA
jgi:hypothetical protein